MNNIDLNEVQKTANSIIVSMDTLVDRYDQLCKHVIKTERSLNVIANDYEGKISNTIKNTDKAVNDLTNFYQSNLNNLKKDFEEIKDIDDKIADFICIYTDMLPQQMEDRKEQIQGLSNINSGLKDNLQNIRSIAQLHKKNAVIFEKLETAIKNIQMDKLETLNGLLTDISDLRGNVEGIRTEQSSILKEQQNALSIIDDIKSSVSSSVQNLEEYSNKQKQLIELINVLTDRTGAYSEKVDKISSAVDAVSLERLDQLEVVLRKYAGLEFLLSQMENMQSKIAEKLASGNNAIDNYNSLLESNIAKFNKCSDEQKLVVESAERVVKATELLPPQNLLVLSNVLTKAPRLEQTIDALLGTDNFAKMKNMLDYMDENKTILLKNLDDTGNVYKMINILRDDQNKLAEELKFVDNRIKNIENALSIQNNRQSAIDMKLDRILQCIETDQGKKGIMGKLSNIFK